MSQVGDEAGQRVPGRLAFEVEGRLGAPDVAVDLLEDGEIEPFLVAEIMRHQPRRHARARRDLDQRRADEPDFG